MAITEYGLQAFNRIERKLDAIIGAAGRGGESSPAPARPSQLSRDIAESRLDLPRQITVHRGMDHEGLYTTSLSFRAPDGSRRSLDVDTAVRLGVLKSQSTLPVGALRWLWLWRRRYL